MPSFSDRVTHGVQFSLVSWADTTAKNLREELAADLADFFGAGNGRGYRMLRYTPTGSEGQKVFPNIS